MSCNCPKMSDAYHDADEDKEFAEENKRIASFSSFPSSCPISATALARAGFYYTGNADQVKCFSCQAIVEGWQHGDTAIGKHRKISPNCRFISGFNLRNDCIQTQIPSIRNSDLRLDESCSQNAAQTFNHVSNSENHTEFLLRTGRVIDESKAKYPRYLDMCDEEARLKTFQNWPSYAPVAPKELAGAGLFYTGINDQVKCFCCGGKLMNWEPSDKAWTEHRKHFPDCYFVLGRDVGNVASESSRSNSRRRGSEAPDNPNMNQYKARIDSFSRWFYGTNKEALAKAGFYSIGDGDTTKCFYCGGILKNWKLKEEPWEEHAKWYPGCKFLIEEKGQHFINHIQLTRPLQNKVACSSSGASTTLPEDGKLLENPLVAAAQQMGFNFEEIKSTMKRKLMITGENYKSIEVLVSDLLNAQTEKVQEKPEEKEKESSIEEKLRQLEEEKICKLCMDRSISIVFIPCGHLVACIECAEAVDKCPICCTIIQRRQRIFMS